MTPYCPFLNKTCLKKECQIWNEGVKNCSISAIVFNLQQQNLHLVSIVKQMSLK